MSVMIPDKNATAAENTFTAMEFVRSAIMAVIDAAETRARTPEAT
jgi:hypothetical protein